MIAQFFPQIERFRGACAECDDWHAVPCFHLAQQFHRLENAALADGVCDMNIVDLCNNEISTMVLDELDYFRSVIFVSGVDFVCVGQVRLNHCLYRPADRILAAARENREDCLTQ